MIDEKRARKYCKEELSKIKNYDKAIADTTQVWHCHHMTETWWNCSRKELIANECYYHRKACELVFLTPAEHMRLHNTGKLLSDETRKKISEAEKGEKHPLYGSHRSNETRKKISDAKKLNPMTGDKNPFFGKHHSEETCKKISEAMKGKKRKPASDEHRRKLSEAAKRIWALRKQKMNGGTVHGCYVEVGN